MHEGGSIAVVDLLSVSPYYDLELVRALRKAGGNAELASIAFHLDPGLFERAGVVRTQALIDRVSELGVRNTRLRRALKLAEYLANLHSHLREWRRGGTTLVHVQWLPLLDWIDLELWWLAKVRRLQIPIVLTVHNVLPHEAGEDRRDSFARLYASVDRMICHTEAARRELVDSFGVPAVRIRVIPMGPFFSEVAGAPPAVARNALGLPQTAPIALCLGTIKPYKGLDVLIEAWKIVQSEMPHARLVIAGNGERGAMQEVRDLVARTGVADVTDLRLGPLSTDDVKLLHTASDAVVLPYRAITQSAALMTAMGTGKAIVATDLPGFREYVGDGYRGLLAAEGDARSLARAICCVLGDDAFRQQLERRARRATETEFSWSTIAHATLQCYSEVCTRT